MNCAMIHNGRKILIRGLMQQVIDADDIELLLMHPDDAAAVTEQRDSYFLQAVK